MSASYYLTVLFDSCVSRQQLISYSTTRLSGQTIKWPDLSFLQRVWLARLGLFQAHRTDSSLYNANWNKISKCENIDSRVRSKIWTSLASQTHFHKRGKGLVNCVYKPCPSALYSAPQSRCSICHMMHYIIVSVAVAVLKTVKGSQDIFPATTGTVKQGIGIEMLERGHL